MLDHRAENRPQYERIPGGQHGLAPELVSADQRARLHASMVQVAAESGYMGTTVEDVLSRAGVSRRTFYDQYENKQSCFIAACDDVLLDWMRQGAVAYQAGAGEGMKDTLRGRLRGGLLALFGRVLSDPIGARVIFIEALNCGEAGLRRLEQAVAELERILADAFAAPEGLPEIPPTMAKVIVGGVLEIVTVRLRHDRTEELLGLAEPLLEWMLSYRSAEAASVLSHAREELTAAASADTNDADRPNAVLQRDLRGSPLWRDESVRPVTLQDSRARILQAAARIASDRGYGALSVNEIVRAARVSHHTFRKHFKTKDEAFIAAYRDGSRATIAYCLKAYTAEAEWPSAVHAGLAAELRFLAMRPELARIGWIEVYAAGPDALELREQELHLVTTALEPGYEETPNPPHPVVSEAIAGGIYQLAREVVLHDGPEHLPSLLPQATYAALAPFIGAEAAASVATQAVTA